MTTLSDLRKYASSIETEDWIKNPTPVTIVGTSFGNVLQTKISNLLILANFFLFYLCTIQTLGHLGWFK